MGRIVAIDYGNKRSGLAVSDELQIIATSLPTILTKELVPFLKNYHTVTGIDVFVVGEPKTLSNQPSETANTINQFVVYLKRQFPEIPVVRIDERFTTSIALNVIANSGLPKHKRQQKGLADGISATLLLQDYLARK